MTEDQEQPECSSSPTGRHSFKRTTQVLRTFGSPIRDTSYECTHCGYDPEEVTRLTDPLG